MSGGAAQPATSRCGTYRAGHGSDRRCEIWITSLWAVDGEAPSRVVAHQAAAFERVCCAAKQTSGMAPEWLLLDINPLAAS